MLPPACRRVFRPTWIALALSAWSVAHGAAFAQTPTPTGPLAAADLQPVVVSGQAEAIDRALDDQEAADNIISVVRADGIGRLPDKNVAEALQRLPGVSIERDQGEGRYVRIRGLGPDLNAVTLNGALIPSPERDRRAVMLDVLPSSLVRALVVSKTLTPDQDANSLGGSIDVQTLSAFDHRGTFLSLDAGVGRETNTDRTSPNLGLAWSDRFLDGRLGVAAGLSMERRKFGSDNVETGGAWDGQALEEFQRRDYRITRERAGGLVNVEYKPDAQTLVWLRGTQARYSDDEIRQRHNIEFDDPQAEGAVGEAESSRELKARKEVQTIRSLTLGAQTQWQGWDVKGALGASRAKEDTPLSIASAAFEADDTFDGVGFTNTRTPRLVGPASLNDASLYALDEIELERTLVKDREHHARLDFGHAIDAAGLPVALKFGAKTSRRTKTSEQSTWKVDDFGGANTTLSAFSGAAVTYPWGAFGPTIDPAAMWALVHQTDLSGFLDDEESTVNNFRMQENIQAAYVQAEARLGAWQTLLGVRREATRFHAEGTGIEDGEFQPIASTHRYTHWLPALHLKRALDEDTAVRAAWTNAVVRPTFGQTAPGYVIDGDEAEFGNPTLKALKAANLDVGIERRLGYAGAVSAYVFAKRIRNFIYQTDVAGTGRWADFDEAIAYANGDRARVNGIELAYTQSFKHLAAPWNGLIVGANATFTASRATVSRFDADAGAQVSRRIHLPSQSARVFNVMVGYETPAFGVRVAVNHKSRYLLEVPEVLDADRDQWVNGQTQVDFSARYAWSKRLSVVFEALNLNDAPYDVYAGVASRNVQYETYGRTYRLNLKYALY